MTFRIRFLPRAEGDLRRMVRYIAKRSRAGADAWLAALENAIDRLTVHADNCSEALEADQFDIPVKQSLFKTRRGLVYRIVFTIVGREVRILG